MHVVDIGAPRWLYATYRAGPSKGSRTAAFMIECKGALMRGDGICFPIHPMYVDSK